MIDFIFNTFLFIPLYNALVFLTNVIPGGDIGVAIILLTIIVKLILFPLYHKSVKTQSQIKKLEPVLKKLKEKYSTNKQEQTRQILNLYRKHGLNPFTSMILLFIQLPIILAMFFVFSQGFDLNLDILYPFINPPPVINLKFLNLINIAEKNWSLALAVGLTQFVQIRLALPALPKINKATPASFKDDFTRSFNIQMRYVMPIIIVFIAGSLSAAISVYWITSNIFAIGHELVVKRKAFSFLKSRTI